MTNDVKHFILERLDDHLVIVLQSTLSDVQTFEVERAGSEILDQIHQLDHPQVVVDLTQLEYMHSAMVAMLVRFWKMVNSRDGKLAFVCNHPLVLEVIKLTGLLKVWNVFADRPAALHHLGLSEEARIEKRESRLVSIVGPVIALVAAAVFGFQFLDDTLIQPLTWKGMVLGCGGIAAVLSLLGLLKSTGAARIVCGLAVLVSVGVIVGCLYVSSPSKEGDQERVEDGDRPKQKQSENQNEKQKQSEKPPAKSGPSSNTQKQSGSSTEEDAKKGSPAEKTDRKIGDDPSVDTTTSDAAADVNSLQTETPASAEKP